MSIFNLQNREAGYILAVSSVAGVTAALAPFHEQINSTTVAFSLLLVVLFIATGWGSRPAYLALVLGMLCFNFFSFRNSSLTSPPYTMISASSSLALSSVSARPRPAPQSAP